jgi:hypothetical protein
MQFAEVFLRLGSALVAWMVLYAHILWLAALYAMGCGPDGDEMHRLLLGLAPFTIGMAVVLRATRPLAEIHSMLRWLSIPLLLLTPFAIRSTWAVFQRVNGETLQICGQGAASSWETLWPAVQLLVLIVVAYMVVKVWRSVSHDAAEDVSG